MNSRNVCLLCLCFVFMDCSAITECWDASLVSDMLRDYVGPVCVVYTLPHEWRILYSPFLLRSWTGFLHQHLTKEVITSLATQTDEFGTEAVTTLEEAGLLYFYCSQLHRRSKEIMD